MSIKVGWLHVNRFLNQLHGLVILLGIEIVVGEREHYLLLVRTQLQRLFKMFTSLKEILGTQRLRSLIQVSNKQMDANVIGKSRQILF